MNLTVYSIEQHLKFWWNSFGKLSFSFYISGKEQLQKQLNIVRELTGKILRMDHTYKFVKMLSAYHSTTSKWVIKFEIRN